MALNYWKEHILDPFNVVRRFHREFDKLVGSVGSDFWTPTCDLKETQDSYVVIVELPGVNKEDIKVELENGILTISGERKHEKKEENEKWHTIESSYGHFRRSIAVHEGVTEENVKATFENGVLRVEFPKPKKGESKKRPIPISAKL